MRSRCSFENHTRFQTKKAEKKKKQPVGAAHTYMVYIREYPPPPPRATCFVTASITPIQKILIGPIIISWPNLVIVARVAIIKENQAEVFLTFDNYYWICCSFQR